MDQYNKSSSSAIDIQLFNEDGTWTKPAGARLVEVILIGGGGGGGGGRKGAAGVGRSGGGGGGGGAISQDKFLPDFLSSTVAITVGLGGDGGLGATVNDTNGANPNANGGNSSFGAYLIAQGGLFGQGGGTGSGVAGTGLLGSRYGLLTTGGDGSAGNDASAPTNATDSNSLDSARGGGGGGGVSVANAHFAGGNGGDFDGAFVLAGGVGGVAGGGDAGHGNDGTGYQPGSGGGGGGGNNSALGEGGDGGTGGDYGGGGGGGGGSTNGSNRAGNGGQGGNGIVVVITYL